MLDRLFFLSLLLNMTGLFRFIAPQVNMSIGQVSIALLSFNFLYLFSRSGRAVFFLKKSKMLPWLFLLLLWPLATVAYAPSLNLREIGLQVYFFSLFLGTLVWIYRNGLDAVYRLYAISLALTVFGMALSKLVPGFFEAVAVLADANVPGETVGARPVGFFLQPNNLAIALLLLFVGWFGLWREKSAWREVLAIVLFLALELATGSRAGIMVGVGITGVYLMHNWRQRLARGRLLYWLGLFLTLFVLLIFGMRAYLGATGSTVTGTSSGDLIDRLENMIYFRFSPEESLAKDTSIQLRYIAQKDALDLIIKKPVHGYGHGADLYFLETGRLLLSAHSQFLTGALQYGIFYSLAFLVSVFLFLKNKFRIQVESQLGSNIVVQFVFVFAVLFIYSSILELRLFYIILGVIAALLWFPAHLFRFDART